MPTVKNSILINHQTRQPIKVGFDLDGVLLYNPVRIYRPVVSFIKRRILKRKKTRFFVPTSPWQQTLFRFFHLSSFFVAPGFARIKELADAGVIEPYLITGRFAFLKSDLDHWLRKMKADQVFKACYYNSENEQPHLFKARMIQTLDLDMFVEDNWDIVERLNRIVRPSKSRFTCWWVSNIMDSGIPYPHKVLSLAEALDAVSYRQQRHTQPKVLVATDFYYPHWTGLAQSFLHFFTAVKDRFAIQIRTVQSHQTVPTCSQVNSVVVWRSPALFGLSRAKISLAYLADIWRASKTAEVLVINSPSAHILPLALIGWWRRLRVVLFHNGDLLLPSGAMNRLIEWIFDMSTHIACQLATVVATYTDDYARNSRILSPYIYKFKATGIPLHSTVSSPVVQPELLKLSPGQQTLKTEQLQRVANLKPAHSQKKLVGFAGRFVEEKGFDLLFSAIPLVVKTLPNVEFVFAGETKMGYEHFFEQNAPLYKAVKPHLTLLGLLDPEGLTAFYQQLDIFVLPSRSDCFALVQAEAALQGVPVVVADIPGARDLVVQTGFGTLFTSQDTYDLAEKIIWAITNQAKLKTAYPAVIEYFNYDKRSHAFAQLLAE